MIVELGDEEKAFVHIDYEAEYDIGENDISFYKIRSRRDIGGEDQEEFEI